MKKEHNKFKALQERARIVEETILWWEGELEETIAEYEAADKAGDYEAMEKIEEKMKGLLRRAEIEKNEMAKIEAEINEQCADAAFKGEFSVFRRKK